jgi:hypothetical protein
MSTRNNQPENYEYILHGCKFPLRKCTNSTKHTVISDTQSEGRHANRHTVVAAVL